MIYAGRGSIIGTQPMYVQPADAWKIVLAVVLFGAVLASAWVRPPRQRVPGAELRRLVLGAIALYGVGFAASMTRHTPLAVILYSCGIVVSALAAWLSRAQAGSDPPPDEVPADEPPSDPDGAPRFDWTEFERALEDYTRRRGEPVESS